MKKKILLFALSIANLSLVNGQSAGDYRSKQSGNWNLATTWERYDGANWVNAPTPPTSSDGVITIRVSTSVNVTDAMNCDQVVVDGALLVSGTLTVNNGAGDDLVANGTLSLSGTLTGNGQCLVFGEMTWVGGFMSVDVEVKLGGVLSITSPATKEINNINVLTNNGTINWLEGQISLANAAIMNHGVFNQNEDNIIDQPFGLNLFTNSATGTINKTGSGTSLLEIRVPVSNAGVIDIESAGQLMFRNSVGHTGTIDVKSHSLLSINSPGNNFTDNGTITFANATLFHIVAGNFVQNNLINFLGATSIGSQGTWTINVAQSLNTTVPLHHAGILGGIGSLLVNGTMDWTNGFVNTNMTIGSGATLNITGATTIKEIGNSKMLLNQGTINWSEGQITLANGTIRNENVFNQTGNTVIDMPGGTNLFENRATGIYDKSIGTGTGEIRVPFTNNGILIVSKGILKFTKTVFNNTQIDVKDGSTLENNNAGVFSSDGFIFFQPNSTFSNTGGTFIQNSPFAFDGNCTINNSATWQLNAGQTLSNAITLNHSGNIHGTGTLLVNGLMNWTNGFVNANVTIRSGAILNMTGPTIKEIGNSKTLINQGTINWSDGQITLANGTIQNENVINNTCNNMIDMPGGTNLFNNTATGRFNKVSTSPFGTTELRVPLTNAGVFNIGSFTTFIFNREVSHTGTINVGTNAKLQNHNTGTFTDNGTINFGQLSTFVNSAGTFTQLKLINFDVVIISNSAAWNINVAQALPTSVSLNHSGTIGGTGSLVVNGNMNWTAGYIGINLTIAAGPTSGAILNISGLGIKEINNFGTLINQGIINWSEGPISLANGTIRNMNMFNQTGNSIMDMPGGANLFENTASGVYTKSVGAGTSELRVPVTNAGTMNINAGTLRFRKSTTNTGTISVASGATLENNNDAAFTNNNVINFNGSSFFVNSGGTFTGNQVVNFAGTIGITNSATWNINVAQTLSPSVALNHSGTIGGTGSLQVNGIMNWTNGFVSANLTIAPTATLNIGGLTIKEINNSKTLVNQGTINWSAGPISLANGTISNLNLFNQTGNTVVDMPGGTNLFLNSGSYVKIGGTGITEIRVPFTNNTETLIASGTLRFSRNVSNNGQFYVGQGTMLENSSPGSTFINDGVMQFQSNSNFANTGGLFEQNQFIEYLGNCTINNTGTWRVNVVQTLNNGITLNHSGSIDGTGSLLVNGIMNWTAGFVGGNLTIGSGAILNINSPATKEVNNSKTLANHGTINWSAGPIAFANGTIQNFNLFNQTGNTIIDMPGGTNLFENTVSGVYTKSVGAGTSEMRVPVTNQGTININSGTLRFRKSASNAGTITVSSGATLDNNDLTFTNNNVMNFNNNSFFTNSGGTFLQNSLINFGDNVVINNNATWNLNVTQTIGPTLQFHHSGTLAGDGLFIVHGNMNWTGGFINANLSIATGTLNISGLTIKEIGNSKALTNGSGTINWSEGQISLANGTIRNSSLFNQTANSVIDQPGGTNLFQNTVTGSFIKSGTGSLEIRVPFSNEGTVNSNTKGRIKGLGTINFTNTFLSNGFIEPGLSPGILTVNGTQPFENNSSLRIEIAGNGGAGQTTGHDQLQRNGDLALNGNLTIVETGSVPNGEYTIVSLTSGTITGTFSNTTLPAGYSIIYNTNNVVARKELVSCIPSVTITASPGNSICTGSSVTFTAASTNSGNPFYQWKVNGNNVGTNSNTYQSSTLANNDVVVCVMTPSLSCGSPDPVTSNAITMTVSSNVIAGVVSGSPSLCINESALYQSNGTPGGSWSSSNTSVATVNPATGLVTAIANGTTDIIYTIAAGCGSPVSAAKTVLVPIDIIPPTITCPSNITVTANSQCMAVVNYTVSVFDNCTLAGVQIIPAAGSLFPVGTTTVIVNASDLANNVTTCLFTVTVLPREEICNGIDDDCDGEVDEDNIQPVIICPANITVSATAGQCGASVSYDVNATDNCDLGIVSVTPASGSEFPIGTTTVIATATDGSNNISTCVFLVTVLNGAEVCGNSVDDDCDGQVDEGCLVDDADSDGYTTGQGDCNDNDSAINPGAAELCDNELDDNCNGYIDENCLDDLPVLTLRTYPVKEGNTGTTSVEILLSLDRPAPTQLQFNYMTSDEDAIAGMDYTATNGVLIVPAGATSGSVKVSIIGDLLRENNERFRLNFSVPINVVITGDPYSRIMVIDDDKGKGIGNPHTSKAPTAEMREDILKVPNVVRRNSVWRIPFATNTGNRIEIVNMSGQTVFKANNCKNNIPIGNVAAGLYFYRISITGEDKKMKYYSGRLLITE